MKERIEKAAFAENLNTTFRVLLNDAESVELELKEITEKDLDPKQEQFTLVFHGPLQTLLQQRTYQIEHERIGKFDLFLVPIGQSKDGFTYEAIFNRFI